LSVSTSYPTKSKLKITINVFFVAEMFRAKRGPFQSTVNHVNLHSRISPRASLSSPSVVASSGRAVSFDSLSPISCFDCGDSFPSNSAVLFPDSGSSDAVASFTFGVSESRLEIRPIESWFTLHEQNCLREEERLPHTSAHSHLLTPWGSNSMNPWIIQYVSLFSRYSWVVARKSRATRDYWADDLQPTAAPLRGLAIQYKRRLTKKEKPMTTMHPTINKTNPIKLRVEYCVEFCRVLWHR